MNRVNVFNISTKRIAGIAVSAVICFFTFMIASSFLINLDPVVVSMAWAVLFICFAVFMVVLICYLGGIHPSHILQYFRYVQQPDGKIS